MKKHLSRALVLLLTIVLLCAMVGCGGGSKKNYGEWYDKKNEKANQKYLYGMCTIFNEHAWDSPAFPWDIATELCKNLGVKSIRSWVNFSSVLNPDLSVKRAAAEQYHKYFALQKEFGIQTIGMTGESLLPNGTFGVQKPARDLSEGSIYMKWLEDLEATWFALVSEFPEVEYWEIGNENNNATFMENIEGGCFSTTQQMAEIFIDILFFSARGIHRANPNAITVMGGLIPNTAIGFLEKMYDLIEAPESWSPYPDDYFQVAAWHPYDASLSEKNIDRWVELQKKIYAVIKKREGKDKKVFFTEVGWSEFDVSEEAKLYNIEAIYTRIKQDLPFVEAVHYFRMLDRMGHTWGSVIEKAFGIVNDPITTHLNDSSYVLGAPKESAFLYQRLAGGSGDLTLLQEWAENRS